MGATLTSSNSATVLFLTTRHLFLRTSPASFSHVCGRWSCIVLWFSYSSAVLKSACDCLVSAETPCCTTLRISATCGNFLRHRSSVWRRVRSTAVTPECRRFLSRHHQFCHRSGLLVECKCRPFRRSSTSWLLFVPRPLPCFSSRATRS